MARFSFSSSLSLSLSLAHTRHVRVPERCCSSSCCILIQDGVAGATYADGDRASRLGHLGLIIMQQVPSMYRYKINPVHACRWSAVPSAGGRKKKREGLPSPAPQPSRRKNVPASANSLTRVRFFKDSTLLGSCRSSIAVVLVTATHPSPFSSSSWTLASLAFIESGVRMRPRPRRPLKKELFVNENHATLCPIFVYTRSPRSSCFISAPIPCAKPRKSRRRFPTSNRLAFVPLSSSAFSPAPWDISWRGHGRRAPLCPRAGGFVAWSPCLLPLLPWTARQRADTWK